MIGWVLFVWPALWPAWVPAGQAVAPITAGGAPAATPAWVPIGRAVEPPATTQESADAARMRIARSFTDHLAAGRFEEAVKPFDATMAGLLPPAALEMTWQKIQSQVGGFKSFGKPYTRTVGSVHVVHVPAEFSLKKRSLKIVFNDQNRISGFWIEAATPAPDYTPPDYVHADRFSERDVEFGAAPWEVKGKLTLPRSGGPAPIVVLVHGSGAHDEDETLGPNKPFRDLATGLSSNGIAVLRYQKRTFAHRRKLGAGALITLREEVIDDALAAVAFARSQPGIDKKRVYLLGHSMGGSLAPHIAREDGKLAGLILMAGSPRDAFDVVEEQMAYIASLPRANKAANQKKSDEIRRVIRAVRAGSDPAELLLLGVPATYWLELSHYAEASPHVAAGLEGRILILGGGRDYQVTKTDFDLYKSALGERKNVRFRWYPAMSHLFFRGEGTATPEEYEKPGHVDRTVLKDIIHWIGDT